MEYFRSGRPRAKCRQNVIKSVYFNNWIKSDNNVCNDKYVINSKPINLFDSVVIKSDGEIFYQPSTTPPPPKQ